MTKASEVCGVAMRLTKTMKLKTSLTGKQLSFLMGAHNSINAKIVEEAT